MTCALLRNTKLRVCTPVFFHDLGISTFWCLLQAQVCTQVHQDTIRRSLSYLMAMQVLQVKPLTGKFWHVADQLRSWLNGWSALLSNGNACYSMDRQTIHVYVHPDPTHCNAQCQLVHLSDSCDVAVYTFHVSVDVDLAHSCKMHTQSTFQKPVSEFCIIVFAG